MRARTLKPSIFKNELLGAADPVYTLVFEALWCLADKEGRLEDRPLRIHVEAQPLRDKALTEQSLDWLDANGFIVRYSAEGGDYIQVVKFKAHQNPHPREKESVIPQYVSDEATPRRCSGNAKDMPSNALSSFPSPLSSFPIPAPPSGGEDKRRKRRCPPPKDFSLTDEMREYALKRLPDMDTSATFADFLDYHSAEGTVALDWPAKWRTWVNNCVKGFGYARAKRREQTVATASRKVAPSEVFDRQPNRPGAVHDGVVAGKERDGGRDDSPLGKA